MTPLNVPLALVSVSVRFAIVTLPLPDSVVMEAPGALVSSIFSVPLSTTPDEVAMLPAPESASAALLLIVVEPV